MKIGLRAKFSLALIASIVVVLVASFVAAWRALAAVEDNLGRAYARNLTQYNEQRVLAPVLRELALSQQLADSEVTRRWLLNENDPAQRALFFAEAARYQKAFEDHSYFVISARSRDYYFNDRKSAYSTRPRYTLRPSDPDDDWFFATLRSDQDYNINVDVDTKLKLTKVWINVLVQDGKKKIGLAGTGIDISTVLSRFTRSAQQGATPIIVTADGSIQAHPNQELISYDSVGENRKESKIYQLLQREADRVALRTALKKAAANHESIELLWADLAGRHQLLAVTYAPELKWFIMTAVDMKAVEVFDQSLLLPFAVTGGVLLAVFLAAIIFAVNRLLLVPVLRLTQSVRTIASGDYNVQLPPPSKDELGELSQAFGEMASQVRAHTENLEHLVEARTSELLAVNREMEIAHKSISDSIQYASLIQNAILPEREIEHTLGEEYFVWWKPRDVVGGDLYLFRRDDDGFLIGVVDCAGHGVPGALMTMIAHSTLHIAADQIGLRDPAAILHLSDGRLRSTLQHAPQAERLATHMDAGLAYVNLKEHTVTFAGAKTSLYWSDTQSVGEIKGARAALGGRREAKFENEVVRLDGRSWYLATDGVLDQSGGEHGFSFGNERFAALLQEFAAKPFEEQRVAFERELQKYQDTRPQRDDITVVGFGTREGRELIDAQAGKE